MRSQSPEHLGEPVAVADLIDKFEMIDGELLTRLGADGRMRLSHRTSPECIVATVELMHGEPWIEQLEWFPGLIRDDITAAWQECEWELDPSGPHPKVARGPFLLTEIEAGKQIDVYTHAPPWEENATPARSLKNDDVRGGWFLDRMQQAFAKGRVTIKGRRPPDRFRAP